MNLLKQRLVRILLIVYLASYLLQNTFFINFKKVFAEDTVQNTNLVALIVDQKLYPELQNDIQRYATDYIQRKISDSKAVVIQINTENFKALDIVKILENMYFDGLEETPSKLAGLILLGNIPLPVVEHNNFIYPSIYPYVDFENQQFIYNASNGFFTYNDNANGQAEIWHSMINYQENIDQYQSFFQKLKEYDENPSAYIAPKIRYDDFVATKEYFLPDNITYYVNSFLFSEDVGYYRYTNLLLDTLKGEHNNLIMDAANELTGITQNYAYSEDPDEEAAADFGATIQKLADDFSRIMRDMGNESSAEEDLTEETIDVPPGAMDAPALTLKKMVGEFLKSYDTLLATKYLVRMRDNIKTAARRYQANDEGDLTMSFDSHYNKTVLNDTRIAGDPENGLAPILVDFNKKMEEARNKQIEDQKYYMYIPVLAEYYEKKPDNSTNELDTDKEKNRSVYENFYFGKNVKDINSAQEFSIYRGTFQNLDSISGVALTTDTTKGIGGTYNIFGQQIEANRGYNLANAEKDMDLFEEKTGDKKFESDYYNGQMLVNAWRLKDGFWKEKNSKKRVNVVKQANNNCDTADCKEEGTSEGGQDIINKNRGGATPLNLDSNSRLRFSFYKQARQPIYDIGGAFAITSGEAAANSYSGAVPYSSLILTKVDNGNLAYIYPRAGDIDKGASCEDRAVPVVSGGGVVQLRDNRSVPEPIVQYVKGGDGKKIGFVPKTFGNENYLDYFSTFNANPYRSVLVSNNKKYVQIKADSEGEKNEYRYKAIDSRVYNTSPTPTQVDGYTTSKFGSGTAINDLYQDIKNAIDGSKTDFENKSEFVTLIDDVDDQINQINLSNILNTSTGAIAAYTGGQIASQGSTRNTLLDTTYIHTMGTTGTLTTIKGNINDIQNLLINSVTEEERNSNFSYSYTSNFSLTNISQAIRAYLLANRPNLGFASLGMSLTGTFGKIEFLDTRKIDIINRLGILDNTVSSFGSEFANFKATYNNLSNSTTLSTYITNLENKKIAINNLPGGCTNTYASLCSAIDHVKSQLTEIKNTLQTLNQTGSILIYKEEYSGPSIIDESTGTLSTTPFDLITRGIDYQNASGILPQITEFSGLLSDTDTFTYVNDPTGLIVTTPGMDITTKDLPIDNIRNITFQGIGGDPIQFNYPNLYEVKTYAEEDGKLILQEPEIIEDNIRTYLKNKATEYKTILQNQLSRKQTFYDTNPQAFTTLAGAEPLANPLRDYALPDENFFIDLLGDENITAIAKLMYYQNITRKEKTLKDTVLDDINENKQAFDINQKTSYIVDNYLKKDNDQGPFVTPGYSTGGYEIAFINSDGEDYVKAKPAPTFIQEIQTVQSNNAGNAFIPEPEKSDFENRLEEECDFDPSGSELIFDIKTLSSPWVKALQCRFKETMKTPFEFKIDFSNARGPTRQGFVGDVDQSLENRQGEFGSYGSQRGALNTETANQQMIASADTPQTQTTLNDILTYTQLLLSANGQDNATSRQLGDQTTGKQLKIRSTRDVGPFVGPLDITLSVTGDNCFGIARGATTISSNLCTPKKLTFNPATDAQTYDVRLTDKAGVSIVTAQICIKNTSRCITKAAQINVLTDPLNDVTFSLPTTATIAGGEIPFSIAGSDSYGNVIGLTAPEVQVSVSSGDGQLREGGYTADMISFSDLRRTSFTYIAPSDVTDERDIDITFSGSFTKTQTIKIYKGYLDAIDDINISLDGLEDFNNDLLPKITLTLRKSNGEILNEVNSIALISTKNKLLYPGYIKDDKFKKSGNFVIQSGQIDIYLFPSFKAGEDTLYISIPGIDTVEIPAHISAGRSQKVEVISDSKTVSPGDEISATIKVFDLRDNPIEQADTIRIGAIGSLILNDTSPITMTGTKDIMIDTKESGGEGYIFAYVQDTPLDEQIPGYLDILVQKTLLPETGLNIMYLNLRGTDWGNQRGYLSDKNQYVNKLMDQSEKLLAVTTQLMDPNKLKSTDAIVLQNAQVKNLAEKEISLTLQNNKLFVHIVDIGDISLGDLDDFTFQQTDTTDTIDDTLKNKTRIAYLPEVTDETITTNSGQNKKILINGSPIIDFNNGDIQNGVQIVLGTETVNGYSTWIVNRGDQKIGTLFIHRDDTDILQNFVANGNPPNNDYEYKEIFAEGSTNGLKGIGCMIKESSYPQEGYSSIDDNSDSSLGIGFTNNFKNVTYFGDGKSVGESTLPFGSAFLINFGDPLITHVDENVQIERTDFDGGLGDPIYTDPNKTIFKVLPIDFNSDQLQDVLIAYTDGSMKILKNYGGNTPFTNMQNLTMIADSIKEIVVGDVDNNHYPDIIVRTNKNKLKIYLNKQGIFDVDGLLGCINTNARDDFVSTTPDDLGQVNQIFFEDMDDDGNLDIITNDNRNDVKIFYGGSDNDGNGNYVSTLGYTCDPQRYDRQKDHINIVKSFGQRIDEDAYIQNASLIRREGLYGSLTGEELTDDETEDENVFSGNTNDGWKDSNPDKKDKHELELIKLSGEQMMADSTGQVSDFINNLGGYVSESLDDFNRYITNPFETRPVYETSKSLRLREEILYIPISLLSGDSSTGDDVTAYKQFEDINGDILEIGDTIRVKTTIAALQDSTFTYIDNTKLPLNTEIVKNEENKITSFAFATGTANRDDMIIDRDLDGEYDFMIDNIRLDAEEKLVFYYDVIYGGAPLTQIDVKDEEITSTEAPYIYTTEESADNTITITFSPQTRSTDNMPDISFYPTNSCKKYKLILFNTDEGDNKSYEDIFDNLQQKIDEEYAAASQNTLDQVTETINTAASAGSLEEIKNMPGISEIFASRSPQSIFDEATMGGGLSINLNTDFIDSSTAGIQKKLDETLGNACKGFTLQKGKDCQGLPVPFNQGFMAPGNYHLFGCRKLSFLDSTLGKGIPILAFPASCTPPIRPPCPSNVGGLFGGTTSMVRVYAVPTLTLGMGIAICLGPYSLGKTLPKPFRDLGGNCIVFTIPPLTKCKDKSDNGGQPDQEIEPTMYEASNNGTCTSTEGHAHNIIVFDPEEEIVVTSASPFITTQGQDTREGDFFGLSLDYKPTSIQDVPAASTAGAGRTPNATFDFGGGEKFVLDMGERINLKVFSSAKKGIIKCIMNDRVDKQILYLMNNLTKFNIGITFPQVDKLFEGLNGGNLKKMPETFKTTLAAENKQDAKGGYVNTGAKIFSQEMFQNISRQSSNPFDAIMMMFKEVPLVNISTKNIIVQVPAISSEELTSYLAYLQTRADTNTKKLDRRLAMVNYVFAFCGSVDKKEAAASLPDLEQEKKEIEADTLMNDETKQIMITDINKEIGYMQSIVDLPEDNNWRTIGSDIKLIGKNLQLTFGRMKQQTRLEASKQILLARDKINPLSTQEKQRLERTNARLDKVNQCGDFTNNVGTFLKFYENTAGLINSVRQNIRVLEQYKKFPLQLYEWLHVTDRYLGELTAIVGNFLGYISYWMNTNATRFSKYVDAIVLLLNVMKTRQVLMDFSVDRSKKCGKCQNDDYSPQSCSMSFLCPKIPVLKIPNFRIPSIYIDLSHINLGLDITLPNFQFKPISVTLPRIPNLPDPPNYEMYLNTTIDAKYDIGLNMNIGFFKELTLPTVPVLPSPPQLPELPSFLPNIKLTLPVIPPAPRIPKISSKIELSIKIAAFVAKLYCIIKGQIGLVGEKGVKGKIEQTTQRTRNVPIFDYFDMTTKWKEKPLEGFDYKLDAYLELKYNFDGFYSFLNDITQSVNSLVINNVQTPIQNVLDRGQEKIDNNALQDKVQDLENRRPEDFLKENLEYEAGLADFKKGLAIFQKEIENQNDTDTEQKMKKIAADTNQKLDINPAQKELTQAQTTVQNIVQKKQQETQDLAEQVQKDYDNFIKSLEKNPNVLVAEDGFATTISAPLFVADQKTTDFLLVQEDPNQAYLDTTKKSVDGYIKALDAGSPETLDMSDSTYTKSKTYLQDINDKILLAQNTTPSTTCTSCSAQSSPTSSSSSSMDMSQFVRGIFVEAYSGGEKTFINTVKSTENIEKIGKKYINFDLNSDNQKDIIMRDDKTVYVKYADGENTYQSNHFNTRYYLYSADTPSEIRNDSNEGYVPINDIHLKLSDAKQEVKNFKMQGQNFESIKFGWKNSALLGDEVDGYLIRLNQRVDTFNDKKEIDNYNLTDEQFNKKYVLILPEGTDYTGGLISTKDGLPDKKPVKSLLTGTIIEVKFYNPSDEKINISIMEIPRSRQYAQITTLTKNQNKLTNSQAKKFTLREASSPRSNQIVAGRQIIADSIGPVGEFTLYRPQIAETIDTGDSFNGFVSTHYTINANRTDNVAVQSMWITEQDDTIISFKTGINQTGFIEFTGLFFTGEEKKNRYFGAQDFNGNMTRQQISLDVKIPSITVLDADRDNGEIIAEITNDLDEGNVLFQRMRNNKWTEISGTNANYLGGYPLTGKQTIITGSVFSIGNTIGFYDNQSREIGTLNPENGEIIIHPDFQDSTKITVDLTSHIPLIKIIDTQTQKYLFQVNLPTQEPVDIAMTQGTSNYALSKLEEKSFDIFNDGSCIQNQQNKCIIYIAPQGQIFIPTPYHNSLTATYQFDKINNHIIYQISDIAKITVTFKPLTP